MRERRKRYEKGEEKKAEGACQRSPTEVVNAMNNDRMDGGG